MKKYTLPESSISKVKACGCSELTFVSKDACRGRFAKAIVPIIPQMNNK